MARRLRFPDGESPVVATARREAYADEPGQPGSDDEGHHTEGRDDDEDCDDDVPRPGGTSGAVPRLATLDDGTAVAVRELRRTDGNALRQLFRRLSPASRRSRFLAPVSERDFDRMLPRLVDDVDQQHHLAVLMVDRHGPIGVARLIRSRSAPHVADVAVAVADRWQGRGAGRLLIRDVVGRARGLREIRTVLARDNRASLRLLSDLGTADVTGTGGVYDVVVELSDSAGTSARRPDRPDGARLRDPSPGTPPFEPRGREWVTAVRRWWSGRTA